MTKESRIALSDRYRGDYYYSWCWFWFFQSKLPVQYARKVKIGKKPNRARRSHDTAKAQNSKLRPKTAWRLTALKKIVAETTYYKYQNQVIEDINAYAKLASITIEGYALILVTRSRAARQQVAPRPPVSSAQAIVGAHQNNQHFSFCQKPSELLNPLLQFIHSLEANSRRCILPVCHQLQKVEGGDNVSPLWGQYVWVEQLSFCLSLVP